jgi:superfamily II DNA or RNA helicase
MSEKKAPKPDLFVVDNSDSEWKLQKYLSEWCELSTSFDIATGYFEIGSLLSLEEKWQQLKKIRILMGDEVSKRTKQAFVEGLSHITSKLDNSIEKEKEDNDFLEGVPAIVDGIRKKNIECRVYRKKKFHAKAYITHSRFDVVGSAALVGSSNFTVPGLTQNVELNIQIRREVELLQDWFEKHWELAEDVTPDILKTIERHTQDFTPFEIYVKSLYEFFRGHELTEGEWELKESKMYNILDQYQKEGYHALMKIASRYNGAFLCDSVGLGKTFVGLMLLERLLLKDNKRVVLLVPKSARKPVWESKIKKYMPDILEGFLPFKIINHTDLTRQASSKNWPQIMDQICKQAEVILIDESHHFRNRHTSRYQKLFDIAEDKKIILLTATPVNNTLFDLLHQIELFSRRDERYFSDAPLGIHSLRGHFIRLEKYIQNELSSIEELEAVPIGADDAQETLAADELLQELVVQRSRAYVKESQEKTEGRKVTFPDRKPPTVISYSLEETYGNLLKNLKKAFNKNNPLLTLAVYYPLAYYKGSDDSIDPMVQGRQKQVVGLIRTLLLKRFESSRTAFQNSCEDLLIRLLAFCRKHNGKLCCRWENQHEELLTYIRKHYEERGKLDEEDLEEDVLPEEILEGIEQLSEDEYDVNAIVQETILDMDQLLVFIKDLMDIKDKKDDKIEELVKTLKTNEHLKKNKVIIFSEYLDTAQYIFKELKNRGFKNIAEVDSSTSIDRGIIINRFSPYYNDLNSKDLEDKGLEEIRVLISTDVLSEGLNLQDATLLINYDLHWNPVRLMQRIGRVDRRLDDSVEKKMIEDHPELKVSRGVVRFWNFLPPDEINDLLSLYQKVTHKTLAISKTFGIEGKKLLTPDDDYEALKQFNEGYEGSTTLIEKMHLEYQDLLKQNPDLLPRIKNLPLKIFSGKEHISKDAKAVFFCYLLPAKDVDTKEWTEEAGFSKWYLYDLEDRKIFEDPTKIIEYIRCKPGTNRKQALSKELLKDVRSKLDKHVKNTYLKSVQAPIGVEVVLKAWMELS